MFRIVVGDDVSTTQGRHAAVEAARLKSRRTHRPVHVERGDGRVQMEYRRGVIQNYKFETHRRRR